MLKLKNKNDKRFYSSRYFGRGSCGKSRKQEHERGNETRCETAENVFEKRKSDEQKVQNIEPAKLNKHLADLIRSVRRKDGEDYETFKFKMPCFK